MTARRFLAGTVLVVACAAACGKDESTTAPEGPGGSGPGFRVVNGYTLAVDVLVDGALAASAVAPGDIDSVAQSAGSHSVAFRATGTSALVTLDVSTGTTGMRTVAIVRSGASFSATTFGDTNAIVPPGATKVRVFHLAPNAGEIQVFRTQPDWGTPIEWQFPFLYDSALTDPLMHPYLQSTVGTWDIRAWRKPSEAALGWDGTTARVSFALAGGEKRTVLVLDRPGGGIRLAVVDQ